MPAPLACSPILLYSSAARLTSSMVGWGGPSRLGTIIWVSPTSLAQAIRPAWSFRSSSMLKCELTQLKPASLSLARSSAGLYLARPAKPESEYPTGEHNSTASKPAVLSCWRAPGKSLAIRSLTDQVWHPMGRSSGLAKNSLAPSENNPANAACCATVAQNSLLVSAVIGSSNVARRPGGRLQLPSRSAFRADVLVGGCRIDHLEIGAVPDEPLPEHRGHVPEQQGLGDHAGELEIAARLDGASLARVEPFAFVTRRTGQGLRRRLEGIHLRLGDQLGTLAAESAENLPTVPYEQQPLVFFALTLEGAVLFELSRTGRFETAIVPGEGDRRHLPASGELVPNDGSRRVGLRIPVGGAGLHAERRFQLEHAEDGVVAVAAHVAQRATAKVGPAAPDKRGVGVIERPFRRRPQPQVPIQT